MSKTKEIEPSLKTFPELMTEEYLKEPTEIERYAKYILDCELWKVDFEASLTEDILRKTQLRAGSLFSWEFEAGMVYAKLQVLGKAPTFKTRQEVINWILEYINKTPFPNRAVLKGELK